jgi:hypothetical protein
MTACMILGARISVAEDSGLMVFDALSLGVWSTALQRIKVYIYRVKHSKDNSYRKYIKCVTDVPLYPLVICSKTYSSYVKPRIILNVIYNVIVMKQT